MTNGIFSLSDELGRSEQLELLSMRLGFSGFDEMPNEDFASDWSFLTHLAQGDNRYAFNILKGTYHGQELFVFDYHVQIGFDSRRAEDQQFYTILMLIVPQAFPKLIVRPHDTLARIEWAFEGEDIKFESAEFSKMYRVRSVDKRFAYDVCNPQMIDYLLSNRGLDIEIQGVVISLAFHPLLPVTEIELNLQRIAQIRALLPEYLFSIK
jgi:hypothetical protein